MEQRQHSAPHAQRARVRRPGIDRRGGNSHPQGAKLTVEVYCVNPNDVPGFSVIQTETSEDAWIASITCPQGKRILNGGTEGHVYGKYRSTSASYPSITTWTAGQCWAHPGSTYIRAYCIAAGTPTVELTGATPGPEGAITTQTSAEFSFAGTDPAGYSNRFKCSLDGSPPATCYSGEPYDSLDSGHHEFVVWNTTQDGRSSGLVTYHWTIDAVPPNVTLNPLSPLTLTASRLVRWVRSAGIPASTTTRRPTGWPTPTARRRRGRSPPLGLT